MRPDRDRFEKELRRHLGLFASPSINQLEASRARIREALRAGAEAAGSGRPAGRTTRTWYTSPPGLLSAAAAVVILLVATAPWGTDWLATVEAADGSRYTLVPNAILRSADRIGTMLTLRDGSRIEMRWQSELSLERAQDGIRVRLRTGGLVVNAATQRDGHLYVNTKDLTAAVVGTMFVVNAEERGTRVTVVEGEVRVREGSTEKQLKPGEQVSTNPTMAARPIKDEVGWSRQADRILTAFASGMAQTAGQFAAATGNQDAAPDSPEFEVASIRRCDANSLPTQPDGARGGGANSFRLTQGRLRALCMTVATLIRTAYGYTAAELDFINDGRGRRALAFDSVYGLGAEDGTRVRGGPDWVRSDRYTIEAVAAPGVLPSAEALQGDMLQRLLERRLQLKTHIESEQVPALAMTVAKGGLKIEPVTTGACEPLEARPGSPFENGQPLNVLTPPKSVADVRRGEKPSCGLWALPDGPNMVLVGGEVPLSQLAGNLAFWSGRVRVVDRTGVADRFNFILEFGLDDNAPAFRGRSSASRAAEPSDITKAAPLFTAIEEQLGLKLESARAPRDFIVIDHVERPSPN